MAINSTMLLSSIREHVIARSDLYRKKLVADIESWSLDAKARRQLEVDSHESPLDDLVYEIANRQPHTKVMQLWDSIRDEIRDVMREEDPNAAGIRVFEACQGSIPLASSILFFGWGDTFLPLRELGKKDRILMGLEFARDELLAPNGERLRDEIRESAFGSMDAYRSLNDAIFALARRHFSAGDSGEEVGWRALSLIYDVLPSLATPKTLRRGYWIGVSKAEDNTKYVLSVKPGDSMDEWSASDAVQAGDIYFMYCTRPVGKITKVLQVEGVRCDPIAGWKGHWAELRVLADCSIDFRELKGNEILGKNVSVRKSFQGITVGELRPYEFNELRRELIARGMPEHILAEASSEDTIDQGEVSSEKHFEKSVMIPLFEGLGFSVEDQPSLDFFAGHERLNKRPDLVLRDDHGRIVAVVENKLNTAKLRDRRAAFVQVRSYGLQLGCTWVLVASPQGIEVFGRSRNGLDFEEKVVERVELHSLSTDEARRKFHDLLKSKR